MKIDFIISSLVGGGAERVLVILAEHLLKKNHQVSIITFNEPEEYKLDSQINRVRLHKPRFKNHTIRSFANLYKYYSVKKNRPNIIISFITLTNLITIPIAKWYSIKIIAAEHNSHLSVMNGRKFLSEFTRKHLYKIADLVTVLTAFDINYYKKHKSNVIVMPNPCTFKVLENINNDREKVILAVGNLNRYHHKGFDNLIPILAPVLKSNLDWKLKIVGNGEEGHKLLSKLVKKYKLENQVVFTGFLSDVSELMKKSSIFILPSRFEGLPMVLLEAMSQGMSCIAYDCVSGPSDIIENEINGILVENQNQEEMRNKITLLIENKKTRQFYAKKGLASLDKFNVEVIINNYEKIFKTLFS